MNYSIKQIDGTYSFLEGNEEHFNEPRNYTKEILEELEHDIYKDIITGRDLTILDIGANVGLFAKHVEPWAKTLVCVEPTPAHFAILQKIAPAFARCENSALAAHTGTVQFYTEPVNSTMNSLQPRGVNAGQVPCITLVDLLQKYELAHVDLAKIDIEGSEHTAITVETLLATQGRIKSFFIELHPRDQATQEKFARIFETAGYDVTFIECNASLLAKIKN